MAFAAPADSRTFVSEVHQRCRTLIDKGIWDGISRTQFDKWLRNFENDEEQYFAARILDALIYRSNEQTEALILQLFTRVLEDQTRNDPTPIGTIYEWRQRLSNRQVDPQIRLVIPTAAEANTKSGSSILRMVEQYLGTNRKWTINLGQIQGALDDGVRVLVFIDDMVGTGQQFSSLAKRYALEEYFKSAYTILAPLIAHQSGVAMLQTKYPGLRISPVELLTDAHCCFHPLCRSFDDGTNTVQEAQEYYLEFLKAKKIDVSRNKKLGHGKLQLLLGFQHAAPNNSLPILWWNEGGWNRLLKR